MDPDISDDETVRLWETLPPSEWTPKMKAAMETAIEYVHQIRVAGLQSRRLTKKDLPFNPEFAKYHVKTREKYIQWVIDNSMHPEKEKETKRMWVEWHCNSEPYPTCRHCCEPIVLQWKHNDAPDPICKKYFKWHAACYREHTVLMRTRALELRRERHEFRKDVVNARRRSQYQRRTK